MHYEIPLIPATLVKRYKRFLADVILETGELITVHTPNTGSMLGCSAPGSQIWLRDTDAPNSRRKYRYSWDMSTTADGELVGVNTHLANQLVKEAIQNRIVTSLPEFDEIRSEVRYGNENSRVDLLLFSRTGLKCYVEVKNVTASEDKGIAIFPDAISKRGTKHLRELIEMVQQGHQAVIFYCVPRNDIKEVRPADNIDPEYGQMLRKAIDAGVQALAYGATVSPSEISLCKELQVVCP